MSKSKPDTSIFMTDTKEEIYKKFQKAFCPEKKEEDNPVLEYARYIVFEKFDEILIKRPEKFGGNLKVKGYDSLREDYIAGKIHPLDLKNAISEYINKLIEPVRNHFSKGKAKELYEEVKKYAITR